MKQIEKVVFNSDVVNDNDHVYFPYHEKEFFALARFPLFDNISLKSTIVEAVRELRTEHIIPSLVFIPLVRYADATNDETEEDIMRGRSLSYTCDMLDLQMLVMTPDCLKHKVRI